MSRDCLSSAQHAHVCVFASLQVKNMIVYVEKKVLEDPAISGDENFGAITKNFCTFREGVKSNRRCSPSISCNKAMRSSSIYSYVRCCSQTWMTYPTWSTSSSVWGEMELCCMPRRSSRYLCASRLWKRRCDSHRQSSCHTLCSSIGERSSSHGVPPGFPGLSDTFQI